MLTSTKLPPSYSLFASNDLDAVSVSRATPLSQKLAPASPHKLKHTGATLAKRAGVSLETISEALTHSDKQVTKIYVNTADTVNQTVGEIAFRNLKK